VGLHDVSRNTTEEFIVENKIRRWKWLCQALGKRQRAEERVALDWNLQENRSRGRTEKMCKTAVEKGSLKEGETWIEVTQVSVVWPVSGIF
jgi:hypothetical protein